MKHLDVAIVGAGPAGSSTAIHLTRNGYSVALLDKEQFPREKLCGDFLSPVNWPLLDELGVAREVLARPHEKIRTFRFTSFSGAQSEVPLGKSNDETVFGLGLRRFDLDYVLLEKARRLGVTVLDGWRPKELTRQPRGWILKPDKSDVFEDIGARMLIGADGRNSWVAHHLRLADPATMQGRSVGFQFRLKCARQTTGKVEIHLFPGGYAGVVGLDGDTVTLGMAIEKRRLLDGRPAQSLLRSILPQNPWLKEMLRSGSGERNALDLSGLFSAPARLCRWGFAGRRCRPCQRASHRRRNLLRAEKRQTGSKHHGSGVSKGRLFCGPVMLIPAGVPVGFPDALGNQCLLRWLIYRPGLLSPLIRFSGRKRGLLDSLVHTICQPEATR